MLILRQLNTVVLNGSQASMPLSQDYNHMISDVNPRYIMQLSASGKFSASASQIAASASFQIPLPAAYTTTAMLHVMMRSDQTVKITTTSSVNPTSAVMLRAGQGTATDQSGVLTFIGEVLTLTVLNSSANTANVEWFLFEMPAITTVAGWRDGSISLGTLS